MYEAKIIGLKCERGDFMFRILLVIGVIIALLLFYVSGPAIQARQVLSDVQNYVKLEKVTPTSAQLKKQSATYRNMVRKCPCYKKLSKDHFEIKYSSKLGKTYHYDSESKKWNQSSPK